MCTVCKNWQHVSYFQPYYGTDRRRKQCNTCRLEISRLRRENKILAAMDKLGGRRCVCCGETNREFLAFDHIDGRTGAREFHLAWLIVKAEHPETKYRVLCANCNCSYGYRGYCPHRPFGRYGSFAVMKKVKEFNADR